MQVVHWTLLSIGARAWFECIDSESNPSDGLSRDGLTDQWTVSQGWELREAMDVDWASIEDHKLMAWTMEMP